MVGVVVDVAVVEKPPNSNFLVGCTGTTRLADPHMHKLPAANVATVFIA